MKKVFTKGDKFIIKAWRQLGFYYDLDDRLSVNQWRFYGSKKGLINWVRILDEFINDPNVEGISAERHYGPYLYLEVMTWNKPQITKHSIAGSKNDLKKLKGIISRYLHQKSSGETFNIDQEYGIDNEATAKFFIMNDDFEPASMDELIVSDRQKVVNKSWQDKTSQPS